MGIVSLLFSFSILLSISMISHCRETLEIGGGGGIRVCVGGVCPLLPAPPPPQEAPCPPPPPPPVSLCPPPPPPPVPVCGFVDPRVAMVYPIIQRFKSTIEEDPKGIIKTWEGNDICNKYMGFGCDNPPDNKSATAVAAVDFNGFNLSASTIESFVEMLPDLAIFHANSNRFRGTIPAGLEKLPYLFELDVSNNLLSGGIPDNVFKLKNLSFLDFRFNFFKGAVPPQLFSSFNRLEALFINNNNIMQPLPDNLGQIRANYLTLANNKFTGTIPRSIGQAKNTLIEVLFLNNKLSGCLPYEIGFLNKATVFDAGYNQITGPIPLSFGCLEKVEQLNLAGNLLYGQIPEVVCSLGKVLNLSLSDNYFTAVGPQCRKLIKKGVLDDRNNCIFGRPNQRKPEDCTRFYSKAVAVHCPFEHSMYYYLPCKLKYYEAGAVSTSSPSSSSPPSADILPSPSPSYAAIIRNR